MFVGARCRRSRSWRSGERIGPGMVASSGPDAATAGLVGVHLRLAAPAASEAPARRIAVPDRDQDRTGRCADGRPRGLTAESGCGNAIGAETNDVAHVSPPRTAHGGPGGERGRATRAPRSPDGQSRELSSSIGCRPGPGHKPQPNLRFGLRAFALFGACRWPRLSCAPSEYGAVLPTARPWVNRTMASRAYTSVSLASGLRQAKIAGSSRARAHGPARPRRAR